MAALLPACLAFITLSLCHLHLVAGQTTTPVTSNLIIKIQTSCSSTQFLDTATLQCATCPVGSFPNSDQLGCTTCDVTTGTFYDFEDGVALSQTWAAASLATTNTRCQCSNAPTNTTQVIAQAFSNGTYTQRCVLCPSGTRANSVSQQCVPTNGTLPVSAPLTSLQQALTGLGVGIAVQAAIQAFITVPNSASDSSITLNVQQSAPLVNVLGPSALSCLRGRGADRAACNAVANLCVLQMYDLDAASCRLYDALVSSLTSTTSTGSGSGSGRGNSNSKPETGPLPWLFYLGASYNADKNVPLNVQFGGGSLAEGKVSTLPFVLSSYALNGTWLGYSNWTLQFQLCGSSKRDGGKWTRFGWNYDNECSINLDDLLLELSKSEDTVFYEPYLQVSTTELYPIPVQITNKDTLNGNTDPDTGAVRRFFFVDSELGTNLQTASSSASSLVAIQFPTSMDLTITLRKTPRDTIYPPTLLITYSGWQVNTVSNDDTRGTKFAVAYRNEDDLAGRFWYAWQTILIIFEVVLAFPTFMLVMFRFLRRKRGDNADQELLIYAVVQACDIGSFFLCIVLLVVSIYYLIVYKLQSAVYFMMLPNDDLDNFKTTVILAIVGQSVGLLYSVWRQTGTDIFFLDWEKPRKVLSKEGAREEPAPTSCWRQLMVANEWNELQTTRVTYPAFTLLMLVMILEGARVIASGQITPDGSDFRFYANTQSSIILRFGVTSAFLLVLFLGQYLFKRLLYYPYISDPITQFVDLMFLANISAIILDDRHSGYYIHGRNQAQHSDTTLKELNNELLKEEEGLVANRGFITSYSGRPKLAENQLFNIFITDAIRKTYEAKMLQQVQQATNDSRNRKGNINTFLKGSGKPRESALSAQQEIAQLFKQMIDDVERNHATQVIDPTYSQMVTQLPPDAASNNACFVHDYFNSFTKTIFLGNEVRMFVYESIFLCAIDMSLKNIPVSALLTFLMVRGVAYVRAQMGEDNLSRKTLVDRHFLM